ncbi:MAG: TonB-dependent receptor [Ignavibacteria bacterium]|nr:TonB-dependent receptor [Ignavibacteria bacterium]
MKFYLNKLSFAVIIILLSGNLHSQTITGKVTDAVTGEGISRADIYIADINKVVSSDDSGKFILSGLPKGIIHLQFEMLGYKSYYLTLESDKLNEPLDIKMISTELSTDEIIVTETNIEKSYQTEKIKSKDLLRYGYMNISEAITKIPGVWQLSTGTGISKPVIRGLYGNRIGIMVNGIRFDNQQWQDEHGLVMSSDGIDNIEVIKGPRSLLFGPEAIGGVVSITDEHPAPVGAEIADLNLKFYTNTLGILSDIGFKGAGKRYNWLIRFGGETHADYLDGEGNRIPETRFGGYTIKTGLGYHTGLWAGRLNYSYTAYTYGILEAREFEKEFMKINETRFDRSFTGPNHKLNVHNLVFQNTFIKERSKFNLNFGYTYNRRREKEGNDERFLPDSLQFGDLNMLLNTYSADASWIYTFNNTSELTIGTQSFLQSNTNSGQRRLIPDADVTSVSGTGIFRYQSLRFGFEAGLRYDIFNLKTKEFGVKDSIEYFAPLSLKFNSVNGSIGGTYKINEYITGKLNVSTGFRAPNLAELTSNGLHEGIFQYEIGNSNFKSEQSIEADAGIVVESKYLSLDISAYNNKIQDYIYLGQTTDSLRGYPVFRYFQSNATLRGIDAEVSIKPADWLTLKWTYSTVLAKRENLSNLPLIPADKLTASIHAELNSWKYIYSPYIELSTYSAFGKTRLAENEISTPPYTLLNAALGCDLRFEKQKLSISISVNNILGKVYTDFMSRIKLLTAVYNGRTFYANNMGRNIVIAVKIPFKLSYN